MAKREMELDLLDNALDYVQSAVEHTNSGSTRSWKYAILHLFAGIELLLKARLRKEHWTLLFADADKASKTALAAGDFVSLDFKACCKRLAEVAGVAIPKATLDKLESLRKLRNRIQHFDVLLAEEEVKSNLVVGLEFVRQFTAEQFEKDELPDGVMQQMIEELGRYDAYVKHRMKSIEKDMDDSVRYFVCPRCQQETVDITEGDPKCLFCHATPSAEELARDIHGHTDPSDPTYIEFCPECGNQTCVRDDDGDWICTSCGRGGDYDYCDRCGQLFDPGEDGESVCNDCFSNMVNSDD